MSLFNSTLHLPSAPYRPARFFVYFRDQDRRIRGGHGFLSKGAARGMIEAVLKNLPEHRLRWSSPESIDTGCGLLIEGHSLEDIMEADPVRLPHPYGAFAAGIAGREPDLFMPEGRREDEPSPRKEKAPRPQEARTRRSSADGAVTAADLAEELSLSPSALRKLFRKHDVAKPYQWEPGPELDRIRTLLGG